MKRSVKAFWIVDITMFVLLVVVSVAAHHFRGVAAEERLQRRELEAQKAVQAAAPVVSVAEDQSDPTDLPDRSEEGEAEWIAELRGQILELEQVVAARDASIASLKASQTNQPHTASTPWSNHRERMERMKEEEPERYEEMMKQREESRQRMREGFAKKAAHFLERDTSAMAEGEAAEYHRMLNLLDETWSLAERLRAEEIPWEARRPLMMTMRDNIGELTPILDQERDREFYEIGLSFGYGEEEATEFVDYLNGVVDVTSMRSFFENMHSGHGGGGPPH